MIWVPLTRALMIWVPLAACQPVFLEYFGAALADKQPVAPFFNGLVTVT
jgi:hypothetical protein